MAYIVSFSLRRQWQPFGSLCLCQPILFLPCLRTSGAPPFNVICAQSRGLAAALNVAQDLNQSLLPGSSMMGSRGLSGQRPGLAIVKAITDRHGGSVTVEGTNRGYAVHIAIAG